MAYSAWQHVCPFTTYRHVDLDKLLAHTILAFGRGIGRSRGCCRHVPPPQQDPILSFSHIFLLKSAHVGGRRPQRLGTPLPNGKFWIRYCVGFKFKFNQHNLSYQSISKCNISGSPCVANIICRHYPFCAVWTLCMGPFG